MEPEEKGWLGVATLAPSDLKISKYDAVSREESPHSRVEFFWAREELPQSRAGLRKTRVESPEPLPGSGRITPEPSGAAPEPSGISGASPPLLGRITPEPSGVHLGPGGDYPTPVSWTRGKLPHGNYPTRPGCNYPTPREFALVSHHNCRLGVS